jgi:hypothetical protein
VEKTGPTGRLWRKCLPEWARGPSKGDGVNPTQKLLPFGESVRHHARSKAKKASGTLPKRVWRNCFLLMAQCKRCHSGAATPTEKRLGYRIHGQKDCEENSDGALGSVTGNRVTSRCSARGILDAETGGDGMCVAATCPEFEGIAEGRWPWIP